MTPRPVAPLLETGVAVIDRVAGGSAASGEALRLAFNLLRDGEAAVGGRVLLFVPTWRDSSAAAVAEDARRGLVELGQGPVGVMDLRPDRTGSDGTVITGLEPARYARSQAVATAVARARARYAFVVCVADSVDAIETLIAAGLSDGTVLTVTPGRTTRNDMHKAIEQLRRARGHLLGFVVDARAEKGGE